APRLIGTGALPPPGARPAEIGATGIVPLLARAARAHRRSCRRQAHANMARARLHRGHHSSRHLMLGLARGHHTSGELMFDHVKFGVSDYAASKAFFVKALEPLGVAVVSEGPPTYGVELSPPGGNASLCLYQTEEKPAHLHL